MSNCKNNELIEKAKKELDLLRSEEIEQAYKDANLMPPIIVGGSKGGKREILLSVTREILEHNVNLVYAIRSIVMQKRNAKNMERILMDENKREVFNMDERIKGRAAKVKEHLGKLSTQEILSILRKSDKIIGIPSVRYFNLELLHDIAYQTCLIDTQALVDFEIAIGEKFDEPFKADSLNETVGIPIQERLTNSNWDCVKTIGDKHFAVYPIKDRKKSKDDTMSIANIYDTYYETICDIVNKAEMDSENSSVSIEDEIKKGIKEKLNIDTDYNIDVNIDDEGYKHVDILPLITNIAKSIIGEDKFKMLQSFNKSKEEDWDKVKEACDKMKKIAKDKLHEEFENILSQEFDKSIEDYLNESVIDKEEDSTDNRLETYVTEMVTKNLYFDEDLREHLKGTIYDAPIEVIKRFFEKHIESIDLSRLLNIDVFEQKDLDLALIETIRGFIFDADNQVYLMEFAIDLYTYYQIQE